MNARPTALIADDEPLLRDELVQMLRLAWPDLQVVAEARNGREAVERHAALKPDICFLDVQMPGMSGIEAASQIGRGTQLVFVTAFDQYALTAFEHGVLDYLVKPVLPARLADTVGRLQERLRLAQPGPASDEVLRALSSQLQAARGSGGQLRWIRAATGQTLRLIPVDEIDFLRSDEKYTEVSWRPEGGKPGEALLREPLKDLLAQLDPAQFVQVHRSVVVNLHAVEKISRTGKDTAVIHLRGRPEVLPVSRSFLHLFKTM